MATAALPVEWVEEGVCVMCGRNASWSSWCCSSCWMRCRVLGIMATASWRLSPTGRSETSELVPCCSFSQFPHNTSPHLLLRLVPILYIWSPFLAVHLLPPTMSSQQCLRRLPSALRSSALRAGARSAVRAPSARSYSAITRATSSGLLSQASKYVISLEDVGAQLSGMQTPWTARDTASLDS